MLKTCDGHNRHRAVLRRGFFRRQKIDAILTQRIHCPAAAGTSTPSGRRGLLRGQFRRQPGNHHDLALYIESLVRVQLGLVDDVAVPRENQIAADFERRERWRAAAAGTHGPILDIFKIGSLRTSWPWSATAAASDRRGYRSLTLLSYHLFAHQLERHEVQLQRTICIRGAATRLQPPFR